jgi:methylglutaconyl-CoA hydratase
MADVVLYDCDARGVATATLNRPEVRNAYNGELIDGLTAAAARAAEDPAVRLLLIRGQGPHFAAGADLKWVRSVAAASPEENLEVSRRTAEAVRGLNELAKPTVALVHGGCFGGATGIIAACDVVVASEDAMFAITEVYWGLVPDIITPQLNDAMGLRQVRRYALSGERFRAAEARRIGLVHEVCPTGGLDAAAAPIIAGLLRAAPEAVSGTKRTALECAGALLGEARLEPLLQRHSIKRQSEEASEGLATFAAKQDPGWVVK